MKKLMIGMVGVLVLIGIGAGVMFAMKGKSTKQAAKPTPTVKFALIGYRDRGDEYVTRLSPLTDDLDASDINQWVHALLMLGHGVDRQKRLIGASALPICGELGGVQHGTMTVV